MTKQPPTRPRKRRAPRWFDRVNRYRLAAGFLFVPFVLTLVAWAFGEAPNVIMPYLVRRAIYWVGLLLLTIALAMDAWEVYRGKRRIKQMIEQIKTDD